MLDIGVFFAFIMAVITVGILMSRHEKDSESYFLAGRGLLWWLIGFSLIAANISTEQFVGMSGQAAQDDVGLAIASYEWIAAITLVVVAFCFLPPFLRSGIYTIPEFLEYRFNKFARSLMSLLMVVVLVGVNIAAVTYSGAKTVDVLFGHSAPAAAERDADGAAPEGAVIAPAGEPAEAGDAGGEGGFRFLNVPIDIATASWIIGILAAIYVAAGGLKACAWADLLQGSALIIGGLIVLYFALSTLDQAEPAAVGLAPEMADASPVAKYWSLNEHKMHMALPATSTVLPFTALFLGIWIPNLYYWGLNQYIMQRTLGAHSLGEGQKGIVFAAALKLVIPFVVVIPGIIAFNLYKDDMQQDARTSTNRDTLARYAAAKDAPETPNVVFPFNRDFAQLYPDQAREIIAFNAAVVGKDAGEVAVPDADLTAKAEKLVEANAALAKAAEAKNVGVAEDRQIDVAGQLIGYEYDSAFGLLMKKLIPAGFRGFMMAAILGAVMSSLASMLNAASTIFTMDIFKEYINRDASQTMLVAVGRACVVLFVVIGCVISPQLDNPDFKGIFNYIQEFQGYLWPGVLGIFVFGVFVPRAPRACGWVGLLLGAVFYGALKIVSLQNLPEWGELAFGSFLNRAGWAFLAVALVLGMMTAIRPLKVPRTLPEQTKIEMKPSRGAFVAGLVVVALTIGLYVVFW